MNDSIPKNRLLITIFVTIFIDMLGVGIIIPVIPAVFYEEGSNFFVSGIENSTKDLLYSLLLACFPLFQFFGSPILGALSDRNGRKPILQISLFGTCIGYLLFAYALISQNLLLLFISRIIPGFTGGNVSIVLSSIADVSDNEDRTRNFGLVGMAFGIGFILGPMIGGLLSDNTILPWFDHYIPFLLTAFITVLNILLVQKFFSETLSHNKETKISLLTGIKNLKHSFTTPQLLPIFIIVLLISIGFTYFTNFFSVFLFEEFDFKEKEMGLLFGYVGLWLAITQGLIVRILSYRFSPMSLLTFSIPLISIGIAMLYLPTEGWMFYFVNPLIAIGHGITSPNLTSIVSSQVPAEMQGSILGINQSMNSFGHIITTLTGGILLSISNLLPIIIGASVIMIAFVIYISVKNKISYDNQV